MPVEPGSTRRARECPWSQGVPVESGSAWSQGVPVEPGSVRGGCATTGV